MSDLRWFLFHDDVEEIVVAARDREDVFDVLKEELVPKAADDLLTSQLGEYAGWPFHSTNRGIVARAGPGSFIKP